MGAVGEIDPAKIRLPQALCAAFLTWPTEKGKRGRAQIVGYGSRVTPASHTSAGKRSILPCRGAFQFLASPGQFKFVLVKRTGLPDFEVFAYPR